LLDARIFETLEEHTVAHHAGGTKITTFMSEGYSVLSGSVR
jgi:hypothetical protein